MHDASYPPPQQELPTARPILVARPLELSAWGGAANPLLLNGVSMPAALFALHPLRVESVAWITELKNTESTCFYLLAVLAWMRFTRDEGSSPWRFYALALLFQALALFAKTTACTLPAALVLVLWIQAKPIDRRRLLQIMPFVALGLAMGLVSIWWERHLGNYEEKFKLSFTLAERVLIASPPVVAPLRPEAWPLELALRPLRAMEEACWTERMRGVRALRDVIFLSPRSTKIEGQTPAALCAAAHRLGANLLVVYAASGLGTNSAQSVGILYDTPTATPLATIYATARILDAEGVESSPNPRIGDHRRDDARYQAQRRFEGYVEAALRELVARDQPSPSTQPSRWQTPLNERWWLPPYYPRW